MIVVDPIDDLTSTACLLIGAFIACECGVVKLGIQSLKECENVVILLKYIIELPILIVCLGFENQQLHTMFDN